MIKKNKLKLIIASIVTLLPAAAGCILWDKLPETMATHWGVDGTANGYSGKLFAVFGLPLILLALFWLCVIITAKDPKNKEQNGKVFGMIIWIMPVISLFVAAITYLSAFGKTVAIYDIIPVVVGLLFVFMGNYMPKCRQNHTIGIKVKWALENEENWNRTHRFAGKICFASGLVIIASCLLPDVWSISVAAAAMLVGIFAPVIYSYSFYKKQVKAGTYVATPSAYTDKKWVKILSIVLVIVILAAVAVIMFTGEITVNIESDSFTVESTYWSAITVKDADIKSIKYIENVSSGVRTYGFGSAKLLLGEFQNDEFGNYLCYCYASTDSCIVIETVNGILVINAESDEATKALYDELN